MVDWDVGKVSRSRGGTRARNYRPALHMTKNGGGDEENSDAVQLRFCF